MFTQLFPLPIIAEFSLISLIKDEWIRCCHINTSNILKITNILNITKLNQINYSCFYLTYYSLS